MDGMEWNGKGWEGMGEGFVKRIKKKRVTKRGKDQREVPNSTKNVTWIPFKGSPPMLQMPS